VQRDRQCHEDSELDPDNHRQADRNSLGCPMQSVDEENLVAVGWIVLLQPIESLVLRSSDEVSSKDEADTKNRSQRGLHGTPLGLYGR
jgi:hypothetical protein